eukprot:967834-Amphidinium_carterae.1
MSSTTATVTTHNKTDIYKVLRWYRNCKLYVGIWHSAGIGTLVCGFQGVAIKSSLQHNSNPANQLVLGPYMVRMMLFHVSVTFGCSGTQTFVVEWLG